MEKRGQVTLYIILGLVILIAFVAIFTLKDYILKSKFEREQSNLQVLQGFEPIKNYFDSCISDITFRGARLMGMQAGYINSPQDNIPITSNAPFSNKLNIFGNDALQVPYWFYETGNGIQKQQIPTLQEMQNQLATYINNNLDNCLNNFTAFQDYDFGNFENKKTEVEIQDERIFVTVSSNLEVSKGTVTTKFDKFLVTVNLPLGKLYNSALNIYNNAYKNNFFEEKTIDMMVLYDEIPYSKTDFTCDTKIWDENKVKNDFKKIASRNIQAVKTDPSTTDYFTIGSVDKDVSTNFLYSENWPFYMQVFPNENGILKGDEVIKKTGALRILSSFLCLNNYHFVYDVKYPILITLNKNDYNFQFAQMVIIDNNQPKNNTLGTLEPIESQNICDRKLTKTKVSTYTINDNNQVIPLDNADISFKCFTTTCSIGKTKNEDGISSLEEDFPQCLNGLITAEKDGYNKATSLISTNQESQVTLTLEHLYNKKLDVRIIEKNSGIVRNLGQDEQLLLVIQNVDGSYSNIINYPDAQSIDLAAGDYVITNYLIAKSVNGIKINPEEIQKCVKVPKGGVLGLFFDESKCLTTTLEGFTLDQVIIGGAEFEYQVNRENLVNSNRITIYTMFDKIPQTNNEVASIYDNINTNNQNPNFKYPELR